MSELSHLDALEAEAIYIIREVAAECEKPVMLYSIGKDSSVMLHLAMKAFYPEKPPFPFLHVNTTWKCFLRFYETTIRALPQEKAQKSWNDRRPLWRNLFRHIRREFPWCSFATSRLTV